MGVSFTSIRHSFDAPLGIRIWHAAPASKEEERFLVLPDARADIVITLGSDGSCALPAVYTGFDTTANEVRVPGGVTLIGVQFDPATCGAAEEIVSSDRLTTILLDSVMHTNLTGKPLRSHELNTLIAHRYDPLVRTVLHRIERNPHREEIARVAGDLGVSVRTIERRFSTATGASPTDFARIVRFCHFVSTSTDAKPEAELALHLGYSDQAHMCREVKRISSMTPHRLVKHMVETRRYSS